MRSNIKITDPKKLEARRVRKAAHRRQYDAMRKLDQFMLAIYLPKAWKEEGLGVLVRELIAAHITAQRAAGKRKISIVKTVKDEIKRLKSQMNTEVGYVSKP